MQRAQASKRFATRSCWFAETIPGTLAMLPRRFAGVASCFAADCIAGLGVAKWTVGFGAGRVAGLGVAGGWWFAVAMLGTLAMLARRFAGVAGCSAGFAAGCFLAVFTAVCAYSGSSALRFNGREGGGIAGCAGGSKVSKISIGAAGSAAAGFIAGCVAGCTESPGAFLPRADFGATD